MTCKHTPGPWAVDEDPEVKLILICAGVLICAGDREIAAVATTTEDEEAHAAANARLIAAAPDLAELLRCAVAENEADGTAHEYGCACNTDGGCWFNEARALLARINGQEGGSQS